MYVVYSFDKVSLGEVVLAEGKSVLRQGVCFVKVKGRILFYQADFVDGVRFARMIR